MPKKSPSKSVDPLLVALEAAMGGLSKRKRFIVGVSGGRDSMVLLHALHALGFQKMVVCHLDHGLRGASSKLDARLVKRTSDRMGLEIEQARARTADYAQAEKKSVELAARDLRRAFFAECAGLHRCTSIVLAHHADDQVETCLFNFLRGSGAAGLGGMKPVSSLGRLKIHRPLLGVTGAEISTYQKAHRVNFREDSSNKETTYTRNKIRLQVLPALESTVGPSFRQAILRAADILREEEEWMASLVPDVAEQLSCKELRAMHPAQRSRVVLRWLRGAGVVDSGFVETRRVLSLLDGPKAPAKVNLPGNLHARRRAGVIFLERLGN
ncbi:MAG: tRNA lysidine(34) synthetase TilS [bacterium]